MPTKSAKYYDIMSVFISSLSSHCDATHLALVGGDSEVLSSGLQVAVRSSHCRASIRRPAGNLVNVTNRGLRVANGDIYEALVSEEGEAGDGSGL